MKPLVATAAALRELAADIAPDAVAASQVLHTYETDSTTYLLTSGDTTFSQRVYLAREDFGDDPYVPIELVRYRREVLSRMASFSERARSKPVSLPRGWSQFKLDNLIAFFAAPVRGVAIRWIAETSVGDRDDIYFWRTTSVSHKATLKEFVEEYPARPSIDQLEWEAAVAEAERHFDELRRATAVNVDMNLQVLEPVRGFAWSFEEWMAEVSADQLAFINAPTTRSIRLRGPAGSGKTLALTLKSIREASTARKDGVPLRVLFVTHSWALATQVQGSIDTLSATSLTEIDVFPLLAMAQDLLPHEYLDTSTFSLVGDDSLSGKQAQLDEIREVLDDFIQGDWVTYRSQVSEQLRARFDSESDEVRSALAWDLLVEFGSVIGATGIFPGAGSELRYLQMTRAPWMLPLASKDELRVVFELYTRYVSNLEDRSLITSDQLLADFVSYLESHAWNRRRKQDGYDLVFVDEFHLFNPLERQVLQYLNRDVKTYPRLFMAADPRQSPSSAFIGDAADETRSTDAGDDEALGEVNSYELTNVHRFTPEILDLVKHIHLAFPTVFFGHDWDIDFSKATSSREGGPVPKLVRSGGRAAEVIDLYKAVQELYSSGPIALAIVDSRQWNRYSDFASQLAMSGKFHVTSVTGRSDVEGLGYRHKGIVIGAAEHLAGLQFENVLVAGIPDMHPSAIASAEKTRLLSMLYLALSRAERVVRVFTNEDDGGTPDVLRTAAAAGLMDVEEGSLV